MSEAVLAAVIVAVGAIAAAVIHKMNWPSRSEGVVDWPRPDDLYMLGASVAKIVWGRFGMLVDKGIIQAAIPALYDRLKIPASLQAEFDRIMENAKSQGVPREVVPHILELFGVYISIAYGDRKGRFFALGFNSINLLPNLDTASVLPKGSQAFIPHLEAVIAGAKDLGCPIARYEEVLQLVRGGFAGLNDPVVMSIRAKLVEAGAAIHEQLSSEAAESEAQEVLQMRRIAERTR